MMVGRTLGLWRNHAPLFEPSGPSILYVLTPSVSFGSSSRCHSLRFSVPSFARWTLTFLHTWPAVFFPSTHCRCPPLHSLDIIIFVTTFLPVQIALMRIVYKSSLTLLCLPNLSPLSAAGWGLPPWPCHSLLPFKVKPGGAHSHHSKTQL